MKGTPFSIRASQTRFIILRLICPKGLWGYEGHTFSIRASQTRFIILRLICPRRLWGYEEHTFIHKGQAH
jgi:hypothetical protein